MSQKSTSFIKNNLPLLLVLLIDSMGLGILFPILAIAFMNPSAHFFAQDIALSARTFLYGAVISVFMLCWFFGAGILGEYSDLKGRKHSLIICLFGAAIGYLCSGLALQWHSLSLLFVGRIIAGFTAGSQSIAQAAIVDQSSADKLSRNMGFMSLAVCLGFVAGPIIGGVFSDSDLIAWFSLSLPMFLAAAISLLNVLLLKLFFHETYVTPEHTTFHLWSGLQQFLSAFSYSGLRYLCIIFFIFIVGWSSYYSFISLYIVQVFHYTAFKTAMFSGFMGLGFCLGSGVLNTYLSSRFSAKWLSCCGLLLAALGCWLTAYAHSQLYVWGIAFIIGATIAFVYPNLVTLFAGQVNQDEQGWVMGVNGSIMALSFGVTTLGMGFVSHLFAALPLFVAALGLACSAALLLLIRAR